MINVEKLTIKYKEKLVINNLSFTLQDGNIVALIGNNGSGKSSIISSIMQINKKYTGDIFCDNINIKKCNCFINETGYVSDDVSIYENFILKDYLKLIACYRNKSLSDFDTLLKEFQMIDNINKKIGDLSKGQIQKIALICAIFFNPKNLILDEAFDGLDSNSIYVLKKYLFKIKKNNGIVFFTSHDRNLINSLSDYIIDLNNVNGD